MCPGSLLICLFFFIHNCPAFIVHCVKLNSLHCDAICLEIAHTTSSESHGLLKYTPQPFALCRDDGRCFQHQEHAGHLLDLNNYWRMNNWVVLTCTLMTEHQNSQPKHCQKLADFLLRPHWHLSDDDKNQTLVWVTNQLTILPCVIPLL